MNPMLRHMAKREAHYKGHALGDFKAVAHGRWEAECRYCHQLAVATPFGTPKLGGGAISLRCARGSWLVRLLRPLRR